MTVKEELEEAYGKLEVVESLLARYQSILYYIAECQAATTEGYLGRKSAPKSETRRHLTICRIITDSIEAESLASRTIPRGSLADLRRRSLKRLKEITKEAL